MADNENGSISSVQVVVFLCILMILGTTGVVLWYGLTEGLPIFRTFGKQSLSCTLL